jgi:hypothetical protein
MRSTAQYALNRPNKAPEQIAASRESFETDKSNDNCKQSIHYLVIADRVAAENGISTAEMDTV